MASTLPRGIRRYENVSQFNREYNPIFGQPPMREIKTMREAKVVATARPDTETVLGLWGDCSELLRTAEALIQQKL